MIHFFLLDRESTLFVVLHLVNHILWGYKGVEFVKTTRGCLKEKLLLIPSTKLILDDYPIDDTLITQETLAVHLCYKTKFDLEMISQLLNKRWMRLDLLSILKEVQRSLPMKANFFSENDFCRDNFEYPHDTFVIHENLSCLPRLRKDEQKSETSDQI